MRYLFGMGDAVELIHTNTSSWALTTSSIPALQMSSLPEGWTLSEKTGDSKVTLTRQFGDEIVQVDFTARQLVSPAAQHPPPPPPLLSPCTVCCRCAWHAQVAINTFHFTGGDR